MQQTKHILDALFSIAPVSCTLERTQMQETLCKFSQGIHKTELQSQKIPKRQVLK